MMNFKYEDVAKSVDPKMTTEDDNDSAGVEDREISAVPDSDEDDCVWPEGDDEDGDDEDTGVENNITSVADDSEGSVILFSDEVDPEEELPSVVVASVVTGTGANGTTVPEVDKDVVMVVITVMLMLCVLLLPSGPVVVVVCTMKVLSPSPGLVVVVVATIGVLPPSSGWVVVVVTMIGVLPPSSG